MNVRAWSRALFLTGVSWKTGRASAGWRAVSAFLLSFMEQTLLMLYGQKVNITTSLFSFSVLSMFLPKHKKGPPKLAQSGGNLWQNIKFCLLFTKLCLILYEVKPREGWKRGGGTICQKLCPERDRCACGLPCTLSWLALLAFVDSLEKDYLSPKSWKHLPWIDRDKELLPVKNSPALSDIPS